MSEFDVVVIGAGAAGLAAARRIATAPLSLHVEHFIECLRSEMRAIEPALQGNFFGGFYTPSDFTGDVHKFTNGLARACERLGVDFRLAREVVCVTPEDDIGEVMSVMTERRFRHLPVKHAGKLIGMVSIGDVVKQRVEEAEGEAQQLREYIAS